MKDFKIKKFKATHCFSDKFAYDEVHQTFQVDNYKPFSLSEIRWCYLKQSKKISTLEIFIGNEKGKYYRVRVYNLPDAKDVCAFLKSLKLTVTDSSFCDKAFFNKYKEDCIRASFKEQGLDYDEEKAKYEQKQKEKLEWRHQHVWPIAKWCLIGFYSLFGICFLAAIFGII